MKQRTAWCCGVLVAMVNGLGCVGDEEPSPLGNVEFLTGSQVETVDGASTYVRLVEELPDGALSLDQALETSGYGTASVHDGAIFIGDGESYDITRYELVDGQLEPVDTVSFKGRGLSYLQVPEFLASDRAFVPNDPELSVVEWNPSTMRITQELDFEDVRKPGWGHELRGDFLRSDGMMFIYITYTNDRIEFINELFVIVLDTNTGDWQLLHRPDCPASAGFGGFFDENNDLYLFADNFGGFTKVGAAATTPKTACVLRVLDGESDFDPNYLYKPAQSLNGQEPWGLYYAGNGVAYTTAIDPASYDQYNSIFEFIFAPDHEGWTVDVYNQSGQILTGLPRDAVGFESFTLDSGLYVPRSQAAVDIYDVEDVQTTVYRVDGQTRTAEAAFTMPGYLSALERVSQ